MAKYLVGNLKMNILSKQERENYFSVLKNELKKNKLENSLIVLCPAMVHLESFVKNIKNKNVAFGAQNVFWEKQGSYTGEISSLMVKNAGAEYVLVGHSERRRYFGETDEVINTKIKAVLDIGLAPILCFGESGEERSEGNIKRVIERQINTALEGVKASFAQKIILAYEPVWSIGSDVVPSANEILEVKILVKKILATKYGLKIAEKFSILYGGSVNFKTAKQVCVEPEMDGVLVGRESLAPRDFIKIGKIINC